ncbi:hypothetical protein NQZ79_g7244 [Umbelopsis isabellina]|nr:hypothetical protein NQZ79_g7244 [Umbelopsis isabellina]
MVKNFTDLPTSDGQLVVTVDDSWFTHPLSPGSANVTYTYFPYLIAANLDPAEELKNIYSTYRQFETLGTLNFSVVQNSYPTSHSSATPLLAQPSGSSATQSQSSANSTGVDNDQQLNASSSKLQPWTIGVIVAACVLFLIAVIALLWILCYTRRQRKLGNRRSFFLGNPKRSPGSDDAALAGAVGETKDIPPGMQSHGGFDNRDVSSIHSATPIMGGGGGASSRRSTALENNSTFGSTRGSGLRNSTDPEKNASMISSQAGRANDLGQLPEGRQSNSVLSSTDALMIADTFRNLMRKPDWNEKDGDELEMNNTEEESDVEKQKRIGKELLRQQLAEEGTQVQRIERRPTQLKSITTAEGRATFANDDQ